MKTIQTPKANKLHIFLGLVLVLSVIAVFVSCSDGIFMYEPQKPAQNAGSSGATNTTPTGTDTAGGTTGTNPTDTSGGGTSTKPPVVPVNLTVNEISVGNFSRSYYGAFSIATTDPGVTATDYYFAVKKTSEAQPTAAEIVNGLHYQRNVSNIPINLLTWGAVGTSYRAPTTEVEAASLLLVPANWYNLYGMPKGGTDADVVMLKKFGATSLPTLKAINENPYDINIFSPVFSVRQGEYLVFPVIAGNNLTVTAYSGAVSEIDQPNTLIPTQSRNINNYVINTTTGVVGTMNAIIAQGPLSPSSGTFRFKIGNTNWWLKTTMYY